MNQVLFLPLLPPSPEHYLLPFQHTKHKQITRTAEAVPATIPFFFVIFCWFAGFIHLPLGRDERRGCGAVGLMDGIPSRTNRFS